MAEQSPAFQASAAPLAWRLMVLLLPEVWQGPEPWCCSSPKWGKDPKQRVSYTFVKCGNTFGEREGVLWAGNHTSCHGSVQFHVGKSRTRRSLSSSPAHSQRLVNVKSRLKHAPRYPSLDRELTEYQQRQLFEYFVVVSLHKKQAGAAYVPELTQQFPLKVQGGPQPSCHLVGTHGFRAVRESEEHSVSTVLDHESSVGYSKQKSCCLRIWEVPGDEEFRLKVQTKTLTHFLW